MGAYSNSSYSAEEIDDAESRSMRPLPRSEPPPGDRVSDLLSTIRCDIDAEIADAAEIVNERQAALTQAKGIQSGLEHVKEAMDRFDAGVYPTDEDAAESAAVEGLHWPQPSQPLDPPATREGILRQLREHPPGFTLPELQARLALSGTVIDGHLRALYKEGAVEHTAELESPWYWVWSSRPRPPVDLQPLAQSR